MPPICKERIIFQPYPTLLKPWCHAYASPTLHWIRHDIADNQYIDFDLHYIAHT
jgi:hypothetical protein